MGNVRHIEIGTTKKFTWVASSTTVTTGYSAIRDGLEAIINTVSLTDSGNGHWFSLHSFLATTYAIGYHTQTFHMTIGGNPYNNPQRIKLIMTEVD